MVYHDRSNINDTSNYADVDDVDGGDDDDHDETIIKMIMAMRYSCVSSHTNHIN